MARLRVEGIATAATAVLSAGQALIAVEAGADVVIPFLGRAETSGIDSAGLVQDVAWIAADAGRRVLAASVKTEAHVRMALHAGCWAATLPPDLARTLGRNDAAKTAIDAFRRTGGSEDE
ncbi:MAG: transaldolase family protein [Myxococcota bacterium]|nr:transaldolase family protein [Myxococcota bacterium]